jgi:pimeloyl-ACP methyl ester carboxylesterase
LRGGKGYASCPLGQAHYRAVGDSAAAPFLLIHQTPIGLVEYIDVQSALERRGRRSIAADNPGYGSSDPVPAPVTVADLADNLIALLDHLAVAKVIVAGHHTGAAIAAAFGARHPARTAGVVLHGAPLYTPDERATRLARPDADLTLKSDGSHLADAFTKIYSLVGPDPENLASVTWATLGQFFCGPSSPIYKAVFANDMAPDILAIRAPTLILTDRHDVLHEKDRKVAAMRPEFSYQEFSAERSFALMRHPDAWAESVESFARTHHL